MTDPTAIRLAIEERRADFAVALADLHNQAARRAVQTTEAEIEAHRATLDLLAKAGADPGGATDACRFLGCSAADLLATVTSLYETRGGLVAEVADLRAKFAAVEKRDAEWRKATGCANPDGWHIVSDRANEAKVAAAESARDAARGHVREVTRQRDEAWSGATPPALPQVEAFELPAVEWTEEVGGGAERAHLPFEAELEDLGREAIGAAGHGRVCDCARARAGAPRRPALLRPAPRQPLLPHPRRRPRRSPRGAPRTKPGRRPCSPSSLWARRSLFTLNAAPLLVTEVFLPHVTELSLCNLRR